MCVLIDPTQRDMLSPVPTHRKGLVSVSTAAGCTHHRRHFRHWLRDHASVGCGATAAHPSELPCNSSHAFSQKPATPLRSIDMTRGLVRGAYIGLTMFMTSCDGSHARHIVAMGLAVIRTGHGGSAAVLQGCMALPSASWVAGKRWCKSPARRWKARASVAWACRRVPPVEPDPKSRC